MGSLQRHNLAFWAVVLLLLGLSWPVEAHNGKTAYAIPLKDITIDGKLDDWPEEMAQYPIEWVLTLLLRRHSRGSECSWRDIHF